MFFDELAKRNIKVHMLAGNHDTYFKNTNEVNSVDLLLREYNNITVIDAPHTIYVGGTAICMMPWICPDNPNSLGKIIMTLGAFTFLIWIVGILSLLSILT